MEPIQNHAPKIPASELLAVPVPVQDSGASGESFANAQLHKLECRYNSIKGK
jgi:hypothetical protein